jgi:hypothetical protein
MPMSQPPRRARCTAVAACLALAPLLVQCAGVADTQSQPVAPTSALKPKVDWALQDAAKRTQLDASALRLTLAEAVTWPDGALGCPEPGRQYSQALVSGYRIRISAGAETLEYHSSLRGQPFFCPASRIQPPAAADPRT